MVITFHIYISKYSISKQMTVTIFSIGIGAQSTFGGQDSFAQNIYKHTNKMPEIYLIFARKIFFPKFAGWHVPLLPSAHSPFPTSMIFGVQIISVFEVSAL